VYDDPGGDGDDECTTAAAATSVAMESAGDVTADR